MCISSAFVYLSKESDGGDHGQAALSFNIPLASCAKGLIARTRSITQCMQNVVGDCSTCRAVEAMPGLKYHFEQYSLCPLVSQQVLEMPVALNIVYSAIKSGNNRRCVWDSGAQVGPQPNIFLMHRKVAAYRRLR